MENTYKLPKLLLLAAFALVHFASNNGHAVNPLLTPTKAPSIPRFDLKTLGKLGGIDGSGGGSLRPESGSAWFLGNQNTIQYCIIASPKFTNASKASAMIERAFVMWNEYATEKQVNRFAYNTNRREKCDEQVDIAFLLGVETDLVKKEKKHFNSPVALSIRTAYDLDAGWGQGVIWLANPFSIDPSRKLPDYTNEKKLFAILLHEIGHVFGNGHVNGTIMTEHIDQLVAGDMHDSARLESIDQNRELSRCSTCEKTTSGYIATKHDANRATVEDEEQSRKEFALLTGSLPKGRIKAELLLKNSTYISSATLKFSDDITSMRFPIQLTGQYCSEDSRSVFKSVQRMQNDGKIAIYHGDSRSCLYKGTLKTKTGNLIPVSLNLNMNSFFDPYLQLTYTSEQEQRERTLFILSDSEL